MYVMTDALSDELIRARRAKGWDHNRAGKEAGISHTTIRTYENGDWTGKGVRVSTMELLADAYGIPDSTWRKLASVAPGDAEAEPEQPVRNGSGDLSGLAQLTRLWGRLSADDRGTLVELAAELAGGA